MKLRLLDLFCGAGGASVGYSRAGFDVTGVDIRPQPNYPFALVQGDALEYVRAHGREYDAIAASPPCQGYSWARNNGSGTGAPQLIGATRDALDATGRPYVIENVQGARREMRSPVLLCGSSFGLRLAGMDLPRHRLFETNWLLMGMVCSHRRGQTLGIYGNGTNQWHRELLGRNLRRAEGGPAMGIDWMTWRELTQAIPPAYTKFIGTQLLRALWPVKDVA
ncbi:MAG TPA: DNA cytosine methyltransferase [Chloroflexota bacterium]|nr:DNA cytosine methyltransferase [Chloroflexota bacterium]